ncbi:hypothetical protein AAG570_002762 [Ranatra chinensis]|uniref:Uncharacterized protein n=1 Tax=Ranatra chinensis TaxID=642074 RepID=A0ABD0Y4T3_9HEMI
MCFLLQVLVEYDDREWQRREWVSVYKGGLFHMFLVERTLIFCPRHHHRIISNHHHIHNHHHSQLKPALVSNTLLIFTEYNKRVGRASGEVEILILLRWCTAQVGPGNWWRTLLPARAVDLERCGSWWCG